MDDNIKKLHQALIDDGYDDVGTEQEFRDYVSDSKNVATLYNALSEAGYDNFKDQKSLETYLSGKAPVAQMPSTPQSSGQSASVGNKPKVAQPAAKPVAEKPKEDNRSWFTKWMTGSLPEEEKPETTDKEPGLIAKVLGMIPTGVQTSNGTYQPAPAVPQPTVRDEVMPVKEEASSSSSANTAPVTTPTGVVNNEGLMDAKLANYIEDWKQRPDKQGTYFENMVADLLADGTANSNEEAVNMVQSALGRYANRSAMDVTNQVVASLPDDTVQDAERSIEAQWYSHGVQDKLKQEADSMGISYDDYVGQFLKPAMVQSLVNKYGPNYRDIAEGIATRLYSHDEHVQDRLMNQDINEALSDVINKYVNPSIVEEYNKAQEAGSKAFTEGMEGSQFIPANLRLGTALGAQYEANEAKDPAKVLSGLQKKFGNLYRNPKFLNDMSNAAFKVMQRYGLNGTQSSDPKQFKPMINSVLKNELDQLEIKGMMPKGSAEYIMKTGLGNTIVGKITRKAVQTDYQNWLEDMANQQYQPGFWENVASGALTFAGDAWSYWLPGAAGGKLTKSMIAKAEGKLAGDLMAKGMERKVAERAAKVLIGRSKDVALKNGAVHGAVTFGGQSAISKPIDEVYRTGQFDENGKVYNPSVGKVIANTLGEVAKQSAVGAIMQGGTIANMVGKGRGLATNILADVGGKVVDSGIMTGQQILERMAHDPNFKPTGKDAAESFLESMANLTAIGLPGMVGKYARFKDAREFNKKFDFTDQDIAELKRFGYDGLRDAFEKVGIDHLVDNSKMGPQSDENRSLDFVFKKDTNKYLEQNYMDLMNDPNVSEVLKAKMMAVVEGKRPSSFSPVINSEVYKGDDGKYYLETYNKDGGVIDRKEYSSHDAARNDEKKLEHEKILNLASVLESELHKEYLDDYLYNLYNQAGQKYFMGEKLSDEEKAAVYLHQHAAEIGDIMQKRQRGYVLTDEEQKQVNAYRHFYNSIEDNNKVLRDFVSTFEDSHGVARGTLRKALESNDKKYDTLVESYFKELYNSIELKREMKQTENERDQESNEYSTVETEVSPTDTAVPEPPVSEGPAPYQDRTNSVPSPSDAESAANLANENQSESKASNAFVMGQNAYKNGDKEGLKSIKYNAETAELRLKRAFADDEAQMNVVVKAYEDGKDMEQFVAQRANYMTPAQQDAVRKYAEAMEANKGAMDALEHADDGYAESLKQQLSPYTMENGNIFSLTLTDGQRGYWKSKNDYGAGFGVFPDVNGKPVVKQVSLSQVKEEGKEIPLQEYVNQLAAQKHEATKKNFEAMFDATSLKPNDTVNLSINEKDQPTEAKIVSVNPDGTISFNIAGSKNITTVPVEQFNKFQHFAQRNGINAELDAEDAHRAENEAIKAEAEKKQRFANGIVGLSDQKPDYSSKETDTKVAAEYLQEQYADNHDQLIKLVNGSRSDIKEQIDNIRKRIVEAEDWLDTNADLEPEQAQSREDKLKLAKEQLDDLIIRYDNWNKIRSLIMTDEEKRDLKDERIANIKKVGIDKEALTVTDEREMPVLTDEELKKQYPSMDEASDYILSQRKEISKTQEELHRQLQDIDARLNQYLSGETDLTDEEIRDFNTTKADLEARMANLSASAKELKVQADKLKTLYVQENKKERAAILAEMTPAEQRKVKAEQYLKDGNIAGLTNLYADTSVDFTDSNPNTVDEYVASSIGRHALSFEGREVNGTFLNGLQQEIGGSRKDFEKIQVLAAEGKGQTFNKYVHDLYDNLPDNLRNQGVNTQEIRNSLIALLKGAEKYSDLKNYILNDKISKAEGEMRSMDLAEEEQRAAYEEEKKQQMQEQVDDVSAKYSLSSETAGNGEQFYQDAEGNIDLANVPQEVFEQIGYTAAPFRLTPKMIKHMMDRHNTELKFSSPDEAIDFVCDVMNNFDHVRLGYDGALVFSIEDGRKRTGKRAVTILINNDNGKFYGLKTSGYESVKGLEKRPLLWERGANEKTSSTDAATASVTTSKSSLSSEQSGSASHQGNDLNLEDNQSASVTQNEKPVSLGDSNLSTNTDSQEALHGINSPDFQGKDTNNSDNLQEKGKNFSEKLQNAIAETETEPTEAQKKAGNYKKGHLTFGGYDFTVETPKGVTRSGKDEQGKPWSVTMHDTYGYILGKIGVDGDHIDMFINDAADLDTFDGNVVVIDQVNPKTGEFDEHKVMYGYPDDAAAITAYAKNYSPGWKGLGKVTSVPKATFDKWLESSDRKTKPFREYAMIQHEEAKKAKEANEALPFDAPMNMDDLPFHRDVKEVKPSDMTEAQKVAYDAVSTMLKKAGIPAKVVSNEDMEKVAEAQDNLNLAMLLNHPEMRFKIKTPEEKQAAENAYNFAKELRPDKWKQYAVVDMSNPNKMPEYFEKQELARKERSYYNKLMWGNYKVFNLDKSFEDNVAGLTGSFPSEFDPYKIDAQTNKRNELKKQIKETEEAYKLTGQERKEYQNQLMKEYMDEHGLASENDIPDDVWREFDYKAVEKYQDKLDSLFAKYKDLDRQLKAVAEPGVRFLRTYHGSGASFDKFDLSHALEGEGSESFGHGVYVTNSSKIGREYAQRAKQRKMEDLYKNMRYPDGVKGDIFKRRVFGEMVNDVATGGSIASAKEFAKKRVGADANDIQRTLENLKDREKGTEYEQNLKDRLAEYKEGLKWIDSLDEDYLTQGNANRYDVDIPDDNGSNYLDWEGTIPDSLDKQKVAEDAYKVVSDNQGFNDFKATPLNDFIAHTLKTYVNTTDVAGRVEKLKSDIKDVIENYVADDDVLALNEYLKDATPDDVLATIWYNDLVRDIKDADLGEELYRKLSTYVGDNAASQILSDNGLVGIKYPAGMIHGGAKEGDYNYVIFDENNANIVGNTKFAQGKGVVYGYTDGKEIVLNQEHLNANTPIHEYQHLWRTAAKEMNPELIEHGDKLIMQTQLFADLKEDPNYKHLSDDEICDEAFARLTGEDGAAILEQMAKDAIKENPLDTAKELTIINRLKNWLKKFWYWTLDTFTKWKPEDIKKMTLEDIRNLVLRDLANGVDPRTVMNEKKAKKDDKTLAGVHNITEEKLRKALKLGGLANPSLAVIDTSKSGHDNFGEISFIAPSALLDKRTGKTGGTWITDAYTQRYPSVEREMSEKGYRKFEDWVASLDYTSGAKAEIERQAKDALSDNNAPAWELMYLKEKGIDIKEYDSRIDYRWKEIISDHPTAEDILNSMKTDPELNKKVTSLAKYDIIQPTMDKISLEVRRKIYEETGVKKSPISPIVRQQTKEIFERDYKATLLNKDGSPRKKDVKKVVGDIVKEHNDTKKYDFYLSKVKASNYVNKNGLYDDYIRWQENKLDEFGTKNRIFRGYTRDGSRKYVPETLENVSKAMREEANGQTNGSEYTSFGSFIAKLASRVDSTDEMRANKDKLSSNKDKEEFYEKWESVYYDLAKTLYNDVFYGEQRLHDIVSQPDPKKYAKKEYGITLTPSFMKKLDSLKNAVQNELKSAYFETKFNRPVHLNEFVAAVVPNNLGEDVRKGLEESGLSLYDYDPEKEGDRKRAFNEAINSNNEIRFHRVTEPEELDRLNKEKTFRMYSGMQEVDGKLYSPMAAIIDGKRTDATEIGAWMGADERPDLVKGGKFQLVKTDKNPGAGEGPVRAAYNPYMHTSTSMMNDQFTGAYARGNIKVVEWEIPESEKTSGYRADGAKDAVGLVPWHSGSVNGLLPKDRQRSVMLSRWRKAVRVVPDSEVAESIAEQLEGTGLAIPWNVVTPNQVRELAKLGVPITTVESGMQAPETKEKFMAQMEELKKEFPQAQFVNVKMTKDAFKEWGGKNNVKLSLGDTVPFVREQRSINNAFNDALDKQIAGTLPKGYNYQLGKPSSALKFAGIEDLPIELSSRTLEVKSSKDYKSNHPFDLNSVKNLPVAIQRPVAIFDSEYEDGRKVILTELKDGKGHSIIAVLGLRKLRGRNYAEVNSIISLYGKDSSVRIANWFDSKNPNGLGLDKNLCRWADTKKASEWLTNNASNVHSVGLSLKRIAKVINSFENNQFSEENLLLKHNFGDILGNSEGIAIENMRKVADSVVNTANKLGGAEATVYSSLDDVPEEYRSEVEQGAKGWYDPETHTVHVYLPNCADANEAERTVLHEKIGHEGMEVLLGGENEVRKFANFVYRSVGKDVRGKIIDFANKYDPDWKNNDRMNVGTQEYIAHLAEEGPKTAEDFSLWTKIKHYLIKVLKKLGVRVPGLLNDKDLRYYLMKAGKALHVWDNMPKEKQEALMEQASNAEIKDALSNGANLPSEEDNKPKKKTERGRIDEATGAFKLAPNGEQSNLSKKQYIEARTKNFKDWFGGDWEKKPKDFKNKLDANGEPLEKYVEGYLNRPKKPTMPKKRKGEDEATFFGRKMLYSQALEDWPKTEADWKKRIDEFDENTLAALTPPDEEAIREKYQKQYENDMASWRKDHPYIKEGEERPLEIPDIRDYQSIQDYGEALRKHEIWKTAPHKDEYDRMAEDEIISKVALMDAVQHPFSEYARLKAMKAEFQHMRHVMQNQKVYDQNTTDAVVQFAKRFMSLGYGDDLGRGSINTLLTIVKNSTGKKSYEISQQLYQVMDVLMNNQLRNFDRAVMKTMSIKELKENAKGIQVQGKLELRGQTTIKAFRDAVSSRVSSDKLDERISNLIDKMAADKKNASSYQDELLGLNLAKQYVDYIDSSRNDAIEIEDLKKLEIENYKDRKGIYKGELTKALLQEHLERLNQYDEALFNNKVERMERYSQLLANLGGMIDESVKGAREFQERDARRAIKVKMMASADLGGKSMNQHHKENWKTRLSNSDVVRLFCSPLGSFDALMREFGSKQINGEGQLWNHFVRGAMKASNDAFKSVREANNEIDLKVSELFGKVTEDKNGNKKGNMTLNDLYALERSNKVKSLDVTIRDIEGEQTYKLQQGNLMYIYMVNKMPDGAMKLRQMGILDADVERIKENIDPRFLKLADWIQGEFLPKMRTKYNKRHEELFGAPMPMVENYFPLRVLKNARYVEEDVNNTSDGSNALPSTATGAIIKRKINKLPLDILNADALSVTIDNINEMENWYNYAPIRKDANTLLSDTAFRNRVQNMTTIYGSGERLWNNVKDATAVAMGTYRPKGGTDLAVSLKNFGKGITGAKISGRLYTAFKQVLSAPLFLPDVDLGRFVRHSVHPYGSFKWAIENLPNFDKRWSGRKLGDTVLMDDPTDWKLWHTNLMEKAAYYGMTPNALVDAVTCAVGARAVYDTKFKQYIKYGLTEERAKEKALSDAEINFNTSQQSSEGAFVSPMQLDRTLESAIFTPFRNSSMLYERKGINALRNLKHRFEKGHKEASIKFMAGQLMEEGVGYEQATKAAEKMYQKGLMHNIANAIVALWLGPIIWNLGGNLGYLMFGDGNEKKKKMVLDAVILGLLEGPVDGLAGGQFINTAIANTITSDGISLKGLKNVDFSGMPMLSDFNSMIEKFGYDKVAGAQDLMFMVMQSATGFNPKTLTDAINACIDYGNGDMTNAKEIALFVFRLMNGPAATVDNLYIDELGMKGKDAKKLSYEELAKRYAEYKFGKNTFGLGKLYSDEEKQKKLKAIEKSFDKKVSERLAGMDREDLKNEFSESRSQKEKKLIGKIIADELETKDSEAVKKAKADASYLRQRNFSDLMDDLYLQKEWEATNEANAGLEELKGNGASEKEIEAYETKHKADLDKRKAIRKARKEMQKKKADISSDNDEATMAAIRKLRESILKTVRQKKK